MTTLRRLLPLLVLLGLILPGSARANFTFFRNYPDLNWKVIKTEHFNVFYPVSKDPESEHPVNAQWSARKTAYVAEEMYPLICGQFNYYLDETVNIVILDQGDDLEGYTIPNFDWIVVSARWSDDLWRVRGHHDWLRVVLYHEFAHVVSLKADQTFAEESFGSVIGVRWGDGRINSTAEASAFVGTGDPWFWVEGGAEYYTGVAGINLWTANRDMRIRMDALEGLILSLEENSDYFGMNDGFDGERHYQSGYAFALYLEERFGQGVYQQFAQKRSENGWSPEWLSVIEDTLHIPAKDLYEDFREWAKQKYTKVQEGVMKDPHIGQRAELDTPYWETKRPKDVERAEWVKTLKGGDKYKWRRDRTKDGLYNYSPRMTADGKKVAELGSAIEWMAVQSEDDLIPFSTHGRELRVGDDIDTLEDRILREGWSTGYTGDGQYDFSPDGSRLAAVVSEDTADLLKSKAEWKFLKDTKTDRPIEDPDGYHRHVLKIVDHGKLETAARGEYTRYWKKEDPQSDDRVMLEKARRGMEITTPKEEGGKKGRRSPSAWAEDVWPGEYVRIYPKVNRLQDPAWSPDGRTIAMSRYNDGTQNIWTFDIETEELKPLTTFDDGTRMETIDWSPDGKQIVFGMFRWNQQDIYVMNADGSNLHPITMDKFEDREPHWGNDGNIYFTSDRVGGIYNVFRLNPRIDPSKPDLDLDGITDALDRCPNEPETANLYRDQDGCPDAVPVNLTEEKIEIGEKVQFALDEATILEDSFDLLSAVARTMVEHPELASVEVGGHADAQGDSARNLDLSQRRAQAVLDHLVQKGGVPAARLSAVGYGDTKPLLNEKTEDAYAKNRRVEFVIKVRDRKAVETAPLPPEKPTCAQASNAGGLQHAFVVQETNVVGGAFWPWLTPKGNLLYTGYSAYGFKSMGLRCEQWMGKVLDPKPFVIGKDQYRLDRPQEVYPSYEEVTEPVGFEGKYLRNPMLIPILSVTNSSLSHLGVEFGAYFNGSDVLDKHELSVFAGAGEDLTLFARYDNRQTNLPWYLGGFLRQIKFDYGFNLDEDGDSRTTEDQFLGDLKGSFLVYGGFLGMDIPFSQAAKLTLGTFQYGLSYGGVDDGKRFAPIWYRGNQDITFSVGQVSDARSLRIPINPRGLRTFTWSWSPNYSVPLNAATAGSDVDDGQVFNSYFYNTFTFDYTEFIKLDKIKRPKSEDDAGHTLELQVQLGLVDRNVPYNDELRAGGATTAVNVQNPFASNNLFAGYPGWGLAGESLAILGARYRFPLATQIDKKVGPVYFESVYMQIFGTVGNLWSYQVDPEARTTEIFGETVLADEQDRVGGQTDKPGHGLIREHIGQRSSENGNYILADAGVEVRLAANLFNRSQWFSFARLAYGFMPIQGRGDVNGDDVYTNSSNPTLDNRSDESEPSGFRFYLGIGTGW